MNSPARANSVSAATASLCILSALVAPNLGGCASSSRQGPRVSGVTVPEGYTVNDRGQIIEDERISRAVGAENLDRANQQLTLTAAVLDTAISESNGERLHAVQDRLASHRGLIEALRYRATTLSKRVQELPENEKFLPEPLRSETLVMQNVATMSVQLGAAVLQRYFPNLSLQAFQGASVKQVPPVDSSFLVGGVPELENAVLRTMLLTRELNSRKSDVRGLDGVLMNAELNLYGAALQMVGSDLKFERNNPGSIQPETVFATKSLGQAAYVELTRLLESNQTVASLSRALSPEGARMLFGGSMRDPVSYARFNRFMTQEFPSTWNAMAPGLQVELFFKLSQRPINQGTYRGNELPNVEASPLPTDLERQALSETLARFTFQEPPAVARQ